MTRSDALQMMGLEGVFALAYTLAVVLRHLTTRATATTLHRRSNPPDTLSAPALAPAARRLPPPPDHEPAETPPSRRQQRRAAKLARQADKALVRQATAQTTHRGPTWEELAKPTSPFRPHGALGRALAGRGDRRNIIHAALGYWNHPAQPLDTTSAQVQPLWPVIEEPGFGVKGIITGFVGDASTALIFDPHEATSNTLPSGNVIEVGDLGMAKTTDLKVNHVIRPLALGHMIAVIDSKSQATAEPGQPAFAHEGEHVKIAKQIDPDTGRPIGTVIRVARDDTATHLNIFDPRIVRDQGADDLLDDDAAPDTIPSTIGQDSLLLTILQQAHPTALSPAERYATRCAHNRGTEQAAARYDRAVRLNRAREIRREHPNLSPKQAVALACDAHRKTAHRNKVDPVAYAMTMSDLHWNLVHPNPEDAHYMNISIKQLRNAGRTIAYTVDRFIHGDLSGYIDKPTSPGLELTANLIVFDLSEIDGEGDAMPIVMATIAAFLLNHWHRYDGRKRGFVLDEGWHVISSPPIARLLRRMWKYARPLGLSNVAAIHHLEDLPGVNDPNSPARALLNEATIRKAFHEDIANATKTAEVFGLTAAAAQAVTNATAGTYVLKIGTRTPVVVHGIRTPWEEAMTKSQQAMNDTAA